MFWFLFLQMLVATALVNWSVNHCDIWWVQSSVLRAASVGSVHLTSFQEVKRKLWISFLFCETFKASCICVLLYYIHYAKTGSLPLWHFSLIFDVHSDVPNDHNYPPLYVKVYIISWWIKYDEPGMMNRTWWITHDKYDQMSNICQFSDMSHGQWYISEQLTICVIYLLEYEVS